MSSDDRKIAGMPFHMNWCIIKEVLSSSSSRCYTVVLVQANKQAWLCK